MKLVLRCAGGWLAASLMLLFIQGTAAQIAFTPPGAGIPAPDGGPSGPPSAPPQPTLITGPTDAEIATATDEVAGATHGVVQQFVITYLPLNISNQMINAIQAFTLPPPVVQQAGDFALSDWLRNPQLSLDGTYAPLHDETLGGHGNDSTFSFFATAGHSDKLNYGLGFTYDRYAVYRYAILQESYAFDAFVTYNVWRDFTVGAFASFTTLTLHDTNVVMNGINVPVGATHERLGTGVLVNYLHSFKNNYILSATTTLASMNKQSPKSLFDELDTVWVSVVEVRKELIPKLTVGVHCSYSQVLDNRASTRDANFIQPGLLVEYAFSAHCRGQVGYDKTLLQQGFQDNRFKVGVNYSW